MNLIVAPVRKPKDVAITGVTDTRRTNHMTK